MDTTAHRQNGVSQLLGVSTSKGYVTFDDILDVINKLELPLDEVDRISGQLLSVGCIIKESDNKEFIEDTDEDFSGRSRLDYGVIYTEVLELDPTLEGYIGYIQQIPPPALKETESLIYQAKDGNDYAKTRIITMYLKVVVRIALWASKKYKIPIADAIQDGNVGIVIAINKFEPASGDCKFSTYAPWWVRQIISREASTTNPMIYFPVHVKEKLFELYDIVCQHICDECNDYDFCKCLVALVMGKLDVDYSTAHKYLEYINPYPSIDEFLDENKGELFSDFGRMEYEMIEKINMKKVNDTISELISQLKPREQEVLLARFGFNNYPKTLEQVGQVMGVTRERVRQIEAKALRRLQHSSRINILKRIY